MTDEAKMAFIDEQNLEELRLTVDARENADDATCLYVEMRTLRSFARLYDQVVAERAGTDPSHPTVFDMRMIEQSRRMACLKAAARNLSQPGDVLGAAELYYTWVTMTDEERAKALPTRRGQAMSGVYNPDTDGPPSKEQEVAMLERVLADPQIAWLVGRARLDERQSCAAIARGNGESVVQDVREEIVREEIATAIEEGRKP